ncbi:MAG: hypothetical protein CMJ67_03910 [Planctomycetaceae bacterium]|nr:hypothetical protein [Planctomycetaceae bacterium]
MQPLSGDVLVPFRGEIHVRQGYYQDEMPLSPPNLTCSAAVDRHADTRTAAWMVGEQLASKLATPPSLVVVVGSYHHAAAIPVATQTIREALGEPATVGITSAGVLAGPDEFHSGPTLTALAIGGPGIRARSFAFEVNDGPPEVWTRPLVRSRLKPASPPKLVAVFADPFTAGSTALPWAFESAVPSGTPLMGGLVSGGSQAGTNVLVADDRVQNTGVVGFVLEGAIEATPIVAHAGRAVGPPLVVTDVAGGTMRGLGGRPAAEMFDMVLSGLNQSDRERLESRPLIGIAADAMHQSRGRGGFLIRPIAAVDRSGGGLLVPGGAPRGSTIQFQIVDGETERQDLAMSLDLANLDDRPVLGVLAASSAGRGPRLLGQETHDAARLHARLGEPPIVGFVTGAEIAPIAGRPRLAGLGLSSVALRGPRRPNSA